MSPNTAVILVDPYNDFLHPDGKVYPRVQQSLETKHTVEHLARLVQQARIAKLPIYYALHQQCREDSMLGWKHMNSSLSAIKQNRVFEEGSWGAQVYSGLEPQSSNGDVVVSKHWNSRSIFLSLIV
jgi:nicotinamidase-related amidase